MRKEEAQWVGEIVRKRVVAGRGPVLNLGSGTGFYRKTDQPYIHEEIFAPLERANVQVIHSDVKVADGVDIAGDLFDPEVQKQLHSLRPQVVLVCNVMEHLQEELRIQLPEILGRIAGATGYILLTVPYVYPLHFDPIDTYYRPSPEELCALFPDYDATDSRVVISSTFLPELFKMPWSDKLKIMVRMVTPFYRPRKWVAMMQRFTFLFRPYKVSCVILKRK